MLIAAVCRGLPTPSSQQLVDIYDDFPKGARVLDVGFGSGEQLRRLKEQGCDVVGVDFDGSLVAKAREKGFDVSQAPAESLPLPDASVDGVICKVVVPYTDEARAVAEWARVMRPGATARVTYHGAGYYLRYVAAGENWKYRVYGARSLVNTWVYRASTHRLPGFLGDTIYQSEGRLERYYRENGLRLLEREVIETFGGAPVFIHHRLQRG